MRKVFVEKPAREVGERKTERGSLGKQKSLGDPPTFPTSPRHSQRAGPCDRGHTPGFCPLVQAILPPRDQQRGAGPAPCLDALDHSRPARPARKRGYRTLLFSLVVCKGPSPPDIRNEGAIIQGTFPGSQEMEFKSFLPCAGILFKGLVKGHDIKD